MKLVWAQVVGIPVSREGLSRLDVVLGDGETGVAVCYPRLTGECVAGDAVLLNTTAVDLALGTGGVHFVVARAPVAAGIEPGRVALDDPPRGHVMKMRYTPLQCDVLAAEAPEGPHRNVLEAAADVGGMVTVCCGLHSQMPLAAAGVKESMPGARVVYVMTDEAALPLAFSDLVAACRASGLVDATVTCGQAFGGELEAVNVHSGLLAARHVAGADVAVVAIGPGVAGTGTVFGHGGVAQGEAVNAAAAVGGRSVVALRISFADARERHTGVSHHTLTALTRVALAPAVVAVPSLPAGQASAIDRDLDDAGVWERHERAEAAGAPLPDLRGVAVVSMGRGVDDDPAFFASSAAAGRVAGLLAVRTI